jgi:hypothetical protein
MNRIKKKRITDHFLFFFFMYLPYAMSTSVIKNKNFSSFYKVHAFSFYISIKKKECIVKKGKRKDTMQSHLLLEETLIKRKNKKKRMIIFFFFCCDRTMDGDANQQQLLLNSLAQTVDAIITEETPLTDHQPDGEGIQSAILENLEWTTSAISQVTIYII